MEKFNNKEKNIKRKKETPCLKFNCDKCCNPIKLYTLQKEPDIDFWKKDDDLILAPEKNPDSVKLKVYHCKKFDQKSGKCIDYENRPEICRNTFCRACQETDFKKQEKIVNEIKKEKFYEIRRKK